MKKGLHLIFLISILAGCGGGGSDSSNTNQEVSLVPPTINSVSENNGKITVSWQHPVPNATFDIYTSFDQSFDFKNYAAFRNSEWIKNVSSPHTFEPSNLSQPIFIRVVAKSNNKENSSESHSIIARYFVQNDRVTDLHTGIIWSRCSAGMEWNSVNQSCEGSALAISLATARQFASNFPSTARLPTVEELSELVFCSSGKPNYFLVKADDRCFEENNAPTIYLKAFPDTSSRQYHTTTFWQFSSGKEFYYGVNFSNGQIGGIFGGEPSGKNLRLILN